MDKQLIEGLVVNLGLACNAAEGLAKFPLAKMLNKEFHKNLKLIPKKEHGGIYKKIGWD